MKDVKYVGGLGDEVTIVFQGSRSIRFQLDQVVRVDEDAAAQLLDTPHFELVEKEAPKKAATKGDK